ncbi:hypothetical protein G9C98_008098 [Cotesia typhae]|uniref:Cysteine rich domain-containing protein n=1 Tax=Cotesia typhae TaxID=2053667 RepID=A0A8J5QQK6_9HYME|nr:hypothetical protein G9C98_008098 [Cotesia typhae]
MNLWKMVAVIHVVLIPIIMAAIVPGMSQFTVKSPSAFIKLKKPSICLPLGNPCLNSSIPCCTLTYQNSYLRIGTIPTTCFKFGKGVCQVNQSIQNFNEYSKLIEQVNGTNFQELKNKYLISIPIVYTCPQKITLEMKNL